MFFRPGENCWKVVEATRLAFLIDGEAFFRTLAEVCEAARKSILIVGWDIDSRIRLRRDQDQGAESENLGALRQRLVARLHEADRDHRLKLCYPAHAELGSARINVHSKMLIVDDLLLTVGSANLNNRSMGFDTECNLALAAEKQSSTAKAISHFRNRLLAEHLGVDTETVAENLENTGSLLATVEALNQGTRTLQDLPESKHNSTVATLSAGDIVDPERPIEVADLLTYLGIETEEPDEDSALRQKAWRFALLLGAAAFLAVLWRWSPLREWLTLDYLLGVADTIRASSWTTPIVLGIFILGSCVMFPVTLLILATALSFGSFMGFFLALCGSLLGGLASYLLGRWLGRDVVRKLAGQKVNRLSRKLARRGWLAIAMVRMVPIAPFTLVNMVAGASHISTGSFLLGTAVGMGPGIMAIMIFEGGLEQAVREPHWLSILWAMVALVGGGLLIYLVKRWLFHWEKEKTDE